MTMELQVVAAVCLGAFTLVLGAVAVYLIQMLIQARKTARSLEILVRNINDEVLRVQTIADSASHVVHKINSSAAKTLSSVFGVIQSLLRSKPGSNGF